MNQQYFHKETHSETECRICGIDQQSPANKEKVDLLIPDPQKTGGALCPVCYFSEYWSDYSELLQGEIVFSQAPQRIISMSWYCLQYMEGEQSTNFVFYNNVKNCIDTILTNSRNALNSSFSELSQQMRNPHQLARIKTNVDLPDYLSNNIRYWPHQNDFSLKEMSQSPKSQLKVFLSQTKFALARDKSNRTFMAEVLSWYEQGSIIAGNL